MKKYFKYFIYLSFAFLAVYLYKNEYLRNLKFQDTKFFLYSIPFLLLGFIGQSLQWKAILSQFGGGVTVKQAIISTGLPIFGKYIPGKIWLILGRAVYVSEISKLNVKVISWISLISQGFTLFVGIIIGGVLLSFSNNLKTYGWTIFGGLLLLSILIFSGYLPKLINWVLRKLGRNEFAGKPLTLHQALAVLPWYLFTWSSWSLGFWLLANAITGNWQSWEILSVFPLSASLGIMAILMPGGLGVREGVIIGILTLFGTSLELALAISIAQRVWFLFGEVFIFTFGLGLNKWSLSFGYE
jgi:uncharacterized membrane protein YbhN (UPF0104 family)